MRHATRPVFESLAQAGRCGRDARGTSRCRRACRPPPRSPRTSSRARPSAGRPAPAAARRRRASRTARAGARRCRRRAPDRRPAPSWRSSSSGSCTRALRRSAASRQVLTTSRCSQVENCDSPRNCFRRTQSFASASCAASLRVLGIAQQVPREPLDLRRVPRAAAPRAPPVAVLRARHEDRVAQLLVGEAAVPPQLEPDRTGFAASADTGLV